MEYSAVEVNCSPDEPPAFSKGLLPVGSRLDAGTELPQAASEYLIGRNLRAGGDKLRSVISPCKSGYYAGAIGTVAIAYAVKPELVAADVTDDAGRALEIQAKRRDAPSHRVWDAAKLPDTALPALHRLWSGRHSHDQYCGTLINAYLAAGGSAVVLPRDTACVHAGKLDDYRETTRLLANTKRQSISRPIPTKPAVQEIVMNLERLSSVREAAARLGPWFHNIDLGGVMTAPDHFLGDYPAVKWRRFAHTIPADLGGKTVLDIGCNGGFYSLQMKARGAARVLGIDVDSNYLRQARFAADTVGADGIEFAELSVYDIAALAEEFDLVLFLGVLYHLRHPLLALDLIREHAVRGLFVCQSMQRGASAVEQLDEDYPFWETGIFDRPGFPRLSFIEHHYAGDGTNWWVPNRACTAAMLRSAGFVIESNPEEEVFVCRAGERVTPSGTVYPAKPRSQTAEGG